MKYAYIENTILLGWYDKEINEVIPDSSIEVTDEVWQDALSRTANAYENGEFIVKDFRTEAENLQADKENKIEEAKKYLADTDFHMTVDKYETLTVERQEELKAKRAEARVVINDLE
jgi:hypothetical protein